MLNDVNFFRKYANVEVLGIQPAKRFSEMADFLETFYMSASGMLVSTTFSDGFGFRKLRGFYEIIDEMDKDEIHITECHDLHSVVITPMAMEYFIDWIKEENEFYFYYYNEQTTNPKKTNRRKK